MSIIMPSGVNKINWSPKSESKVVKVAGSDKGAEPVETDSLEAAARDFLGKKAQEVVEVECPEPGCDDMIEKEVGGDETSVVEVSEPSDVEEVTETEEPCDEVAVESIEVAVEAVEDALEEVKDAVSEAKGKGVSEDEITEVEIEIPGVPETEEEAEVEEVVEDKEGEIEKESTQYTEMSADEDVTLAGSSEEFCKFAKLSPQNRSKIADYWVNMLGYPKDYVTLLTKDYEK